MAFHSHRHPGQLAASVGLLLLAAGICLPATAQQLRIETDVYAGDETEPLSQNVTLFDEGVVYDFLKNPDQITVFRLPTRSRPGQFVLLDVATKTRTEVSTARIEGLMKKLSTWAAAQEDPLLKFSASPEFEEEFDESSGALTLKHPLWNYTVATVPAEDDEKLDNYKKFTDWFSRLQTMLQSSPPPGPRLALNAALEKHGVVPVEIHRSLSNSACQLRATHLFSWRLSRDDEARLEEARKYLASFKKLENREFLSQRNQRDVARGQSQ